MDVQEVRDNLIDAVFCTARWPLTKVAPLLGADDVEAWPPVLAVDSVQAGAREWLGSVMGDEDLVQAGHDLRRRTDDVRAASAAETAAKVIEMRARDRYEEERSEVEDELVDAQQEVRDRR